MSGYKRFIFRKLIYDSMAWQSRNGGGNSISPRTSHYTSIYCRLKDMQDE
jgi:hypothetical protein